jgi:uncharacterized membrane protein (UPF0127 family)
MMVKQNSTTGLLGSVFFCLAMLTIASTAHGKTTAQQDAPQAMLLPTTELSIGQQSVHAEVAATEASRQRGLMYRQLLPNNQGMLFVFDEAAVQCFWMKNTPLPLSIAFIDARGMIANITDMQAQSTDVHCPAGPIRYALEMKQGWFTEHHIGAGLPVAGLPR